jgi:hypothetical protein
MNILCTSSCVDICVQVSRTHGEESYCGSHSNSMLNFVRPAKMFSPEVELSWLICSGILLCFLFKFLSWLIMLKFFSCAFWFFVYLHWRNVFANSLFIFFQVDYLFVVSFKKCLCIFDVGHFQIYGLQILLSLCEFFVFTFFE